MHRCNRGHELKVINGVCPACNRERQARHRERNQAAMRFLKELESRSMNLRTKV